MNHTHLLAAVLTPFAFMVLVLAPGCDIVGLIDPGDPGNGLVDNSDDGSDDGDNGVAPGGGSDVSGKTYYVSNGGDDGADGLSTGTAFKTLGRAGQVFRAGDTIAILPGVYVERLTLEAVGSAQAPITIHGTAPGAVLDGEHRIDIGIWCEECVNLVIEDLEVRNYTDIGIIVTRSTTATLRRLDIHGNGNVATLEWVEGYGLQVEESTGVLIEDNEVYANGPSPQRPGRLMGTGIDTFGNTDVVIRNNNSHDNTGGGYLIEDSVNVLFENNIATGNDLDASAEEWWDGALWVDGGHDVTVRNNTFSGNLGPGLEISNEDNQNVFGYVVENNTMTDNYYGIYIWNFGTTDLPPENILRLAGNVISGSSIQDIWIEALPCPPDDPSTRLCLKTSLPPAFPPLSGGHGRSR